MEADATSSTRLIDFLGWVEVNKVKLAAGAGILAVAIAAFAMYRAHRAATEAEAMAALFKARPPMSRAENAPKPGAQSFLDVAAKYAGTRAAAQASLLAAEVLYGEGKWVEAQAQFEMFQQQYGNDALVPAAAFGVAACLDAQGKSNEALKAYQAVIGRFGISAVVAQARLNMARLYAGQQQPAQALKLYEEVMRPNAPSVWRDDAAMHRERLLVDHPELAVIQTPVITPGGVLDLMNTNPVIATQSNAAPVVPQPKP